MASSIGNSSGGQLSKCSHKDSVWTKPKELQTWLWNIIATINVGDGRYPFLARKSTFGSGIGYEGTSKDSVNVLRAAVVILNRVNAEWVTGSRAYSAKPWRPGTGA